MNEWRVWGFNRPEFKAQICHLLTANFGKLRKLPKLRFPLLKNEEDILTL